MFTGVAWAQDIGPAAAMFQLADGNGDGLVTREEAVAARTREFDVLDRTRDGYLDDADRPSLPPLPSVPSLPPLPGQGTWGAQDPAAERNLPAPLDADKDGKVSKAEFVDGGTRLFALADANHDGKLDRQELTLPSPSTAPPRQP
jgi:Ca2+-binding EF-hand superfamily protein